MSSGRKPSGTPARNASAAATPTTRAPAESPTRFTVSTTPSAAIRPPTIRPSAGRAPRRRIARPRWTSAACARPRSPACWSSARARARTASPFARRSSVSIARRPGRASRRAWPRWRRRWRRASASVDALAHLAAAVRPDDPAAILYTSGTTGQPKGALYRHGQHLAACANILAHYPVLTDGEHRVVAMLPLCHTMGRNTVITMPLLADIVPHYPESLDTVAETLYEVAPTFVFTVPRYLQKFAAHLLVGIDASSPLKRAAYRAALRLGRRGAAGVVARALVFRWLLEKAGLARVRLLISSGAPLPPAVAALWQAWGVNLCEAYGQTETGGALVSGQRGPYPRPGDVGTPAPHVEVALGDDGELRVRGPDLFAGYWRDPEATSAAYRDGWLLTGDVAERTAEGALRLVDRRKDLVITAGGKHVSPSQIETGLRASPYVSDAVVFGEGRKYLGALIEMDYETVAEWARARGLTHTGYASLAAHPEVTRLLDGEIARANASLGRVEQVKAFRVLPRELDPEQEGEPVTPTRKVKRRLMLERYRDLVESMYTSDEERRIASEVASLLQERLT